MSKNICRAFTLYHNKVFVNTTADDLEEELKKDYLVLGYFDWFKTESWLMDDFSFSLTKLFEYNNKINEEGTSLQSFQNVFGFREDDEKDACTDEVFWSPANDDSLTFVLYLQVAKYNSKLYTTIENILKEKQKDGSFEGQFIVYYTLDKNDFVICFKSQRYSMIVRTINYLYDRMIKSDDIIIYSYTNLMIKYSVLNNSSSIMITPSQSAEIIDSICIKTTLNHFHLKQYNIQQKTDYFCKRLAEELYDNNVDMLNNKNIVGYEILGDNDCRFIARQVPIDRLLSLFSTTGLLNAKNPLFRYSFISSMTSLNIDTFLIENCFVDVPKDDKKNRVVPLVERKKIDLLGKRLCESNNKHLITLLYQIYDYICFTGYQPSKYEFISLKKPFGLLIRLIEKAILNEKEIAQRPFDELYEYLSNMYTSIQENMKTDIRFYGLSDFSVMSYYSPTKLRSFYFAIVNSISEYYRNMSNQDKKIEYQFLIFFTNTNTTNVKQLWRNKFDEDKIMMVKISEKDFYDVNNLIFQLAHEAAHFVGNEEIRNREYRFYQLVNYLMARVYQHIRSVIEKKYELKLTDNLGQDTVNYSLKSLLINKLKRTPFSNFLSNKHDVIKARVEIFIRDKLKNGDIEEAKFFYYTDNVKLFIGDFLYKNEFMLSLFNEYFNNIFEDVKIDLMHLLNQKELSIKTIKQIVSQFKQIKNDLPSIVYDYEHQLLYTMCSDLALSVNVMYESYSDLSATLLFDLSAEYFCDIIAKYLDFSKQSHTKRSYEKNMLFIRMCIVIKALQQLSKQYDCIDDSYITFFDECPNNWKNNTYKVDWYNSINKMCNILDNKEYPYYYLYKYILECLRTQCNILIGDSSSSDRRKSLKDIYDHTKDSDLLQTVIYISNFVADLWKNDNSQ